MKLLTLAILMAASQTIWAKGSVKVTGSGTGYGVCSTTNPRCIFDFETRKYCKESAKNEAKERAEFNCHQKGGTVIDNAVITKSESIKTTGWVDSYDCYAVAEVKCAL